MSGGPGGGDPTPAQAEASHRTKGLLRLTMACNERCPFCNVPAERYSPLTPPAEEISEQLEAFVQTGQQTLTISGGEPTLLRARLVELVAAARARGVPFVELQTNAVLIDAAYAAELAAAGLTSAFVSLLSHRAAWHDELAGLPDAFEPCLRGIGALLDVGVRVTLNPVIAALTQGSVADYVAFVARRLPRVRTISLSAVQPHGRAADDLDLLPDYAALGPAVRAARAAAGERGIELLNPYCGLPLCVGWEDGAERSVEAIEAADGGWRDTPGLTNAGDKGHGEPCAPCLLRTRCGGAWHAYWRHRRGSGLQAPAQGDPPFLPRSASPHEAIVRGEAVDAGLLASLRAAEQATVWAVLPRLDRAWLPALREAGCTDLSLRLDPVTVFDDRATLASARQLLRAEAGGAPQHRLRLHAGLGRGAGLERAIALMRSLGVDSIWLVGERASRLVSRRA